MKEKEDLALSHYSTSVHVGCASRMLWPEYVCAPGHRALDPIPITRGRYDNFRIFNSSKTSEAVQGLGKATSVIP